MYEPRILPTCRNELLTPLAKVLIPAVAAKATRAMIRTYSTNPWPDSSSRRVAANRRNNFICTFLSLSTCSIEEGSLVVYSFSHLGQAGNYVMYEPRILPTCRN